MKVESVNVASGVVTPSPSGKVVTSPRNESECPPKKCFPMMPLETAWWNPSYSQWTKVRLPISAFFFWGTPTLPEKFNSMKPKATMIVSYVTNSQRSRFYRYIAAKDGNLQVGLEAKGWDSGEEWNKQPPPFRLREFWGGTVNKNFPVRETILPNLCVTSWCFTGEKRTTFTLQYQLIN